MYISPKRRMVGCLIAEAITIAYPCSRSCPPQVSICRLYTMHVRLAGMTGTTGTQDACQCAPLLIAGAEEYLAITNDPVAG